MKYKKMNKLKKDFEQIIKEKDIKIEELSDWCMKNSISKIKDSMLRKRINAWCKQASKIHTNDFISELLCEAIELFENILEGGKL
jgi:hypothetical protein